MRDFHALPYGRASAPIGRQHDLRDPPKGLVRPREPVVTCPLLTVVCFSICSPGNFQGGSFPQKLIGSSPETAESSFCGERTNVPSEGGCKTRANHQ